MSDPFPFPEIQSMLFLKERIMRLINRTGSYSSSEHPTLQKSSPPMSSSEGCENGISNLNGDGVPQQENKNDLQKEVLVALFNAADESDVSRRRRRERPGRRSRALGTLVVEPPRDIELEHNAASVVLKQDNNDDEDEDEEDAYQELCRAVEEYRATMKEYYKAVVAAFANGDHDRANKLMDEVMKLLEKESIKWSEGEKAGTILVRLDIINPKALSFAKI